MNYLGRDRWSCAAGLHEYHRALGRLRECAQQPCAQPDCLQWCAQERLDRLRFDVQVDVEARSGARARERMTAVEADAFYPALRRLHAELAAIDIPAVPERWLPVLDRAQQLLRDAVHGLRRG